ncbi:MAG TPA: M23 family metallopeptidase [Methylomirabilota bacterium]|nr:M23 family metallopeptidase [Methylomirabilota bacterium]
MRSRPARLRHRIGRALIVPVLLAPVSLVPALVSDAQTRPAAASSAAPPASGKGAGGSRSVTTKITGTGKTAPRVRDAACTHRARNGESISLIAARYRVSRAAVVNANHLPDAHTLRIGQRLTIPGCRPSPGPEREGPVVLSPEGSIRRRVGPLRVLTELVLAPRPDFEEERIPIAWPLEGAVISTFGRRARGWHAGIDITGEMGSQILAAAAGTVLFSGWIRAYGHVVKVQHTGDFITLYAHNQKNLVEEGEEVEAGQVIAIVGRSGHASGPHLHFEVRRHGKAYNPLHLLEQTDQTPVLEGDVAASSSEADPHE